MANEADIRAIVQTIEPLFKKLHNTLYEIILVDIEKKQTINVFFEWGRIGHATISRQVKAVSYRSEQEKASFLKALKAKTPLPISWQ
ncbi:WGR domain-containing protein [Fructobacillus sp. W13]|uniref:WGR domain-containing protein n=1 Tax=Fructobacillus apis TaxID=2935017 RepID=A0ABT0ZND6_9LACO|nr:WGR domain-containing protein [Fructobacillus apis]MCO0831505.1 WGR domain-containing protein [Fructobacillus apis]